MKQQPSQMAGGRASFLPAIILTVLSAFLLYLAFPNKFSFLGYNLCAFVFAVPLFAALENRSLPQRIFLGLLFGYLFHGFVVSWFIPYSLPGYLFFVSILTIQPVIFCLFYRTFSSRRVSAVFIPALWTAGEYVRGLFMQGESWNIGYTQSFNVYLIQAGSVFGAWIVSFLLVFVNHGIYQSIQQPGLRRRYAMAIVIFLAGFYIYGFMTVKPAGRGQEISVVSLQPDIEYPDRISMADSVRIAGEHIRMTAEIPAERKPDLVIWPETAVPSDFTRDVKLLPAIQSLVQQRDAYFLIGAAIDEKNGLFNGAVFLDKDGSVVDIYKKIYLVPFSEFYPSGGLWNLTHFFAGNESQNFSHGARPGILRFPADDIRLGGRRFAVAICSEDNIASLFRRYRLKGAEFMIVLLNNGWFRDKAGLVMHGQHSIMRAVENRVPVIRSSNNGWTMSIDRYGRVDEDGLAGMHQKKVFHYSVEPNKDIPVYAIIGDTFCWMCSAFVIMVLFYDKKRA